MRNLQKLEMTALSELRPDECETMVASDAFVRLRMDGTVETTVYIGDTELRFRNAVKEVYVEGKPATRLLFRALRLTQIALGSDVLDDSKELVDDSEEPDDE